MKKLQDVDRCVKCGCSDGTYFTGLCATDGCGCKCVFPSTSVSEADDKNSFEPKPKAPSHSSVVVPESVSLTLAEIRERRAIIPDRLYNIQNPVHSGADHHFYAEPREWTSFGQLATVSTVYAPFFANAPTDIDCLLSIIDSLQQERGALVQLQKECIGEPFAADPSKWGHIAQIEIRDNAFTTARASERERCAKIAENMRPTGGRMWTDEQHACYAALTDCAAAIRATTQPEDDRQTTTGESLSPASQTESSSESESTLVTEVSKEQDNAKS